MKDFLMSAKFHLWLNGIMLLIWAVLFIPSMTTLKDSIMWVVFMSTYANFVGHFSAFMTAIAEKKTEENE